MGVTIIGPSASTFPSVACAPVVYLKRDWNDAWRYQPTLRLVHGTACSAGHGLSGCTVTGPYGSIKFPWQTNFGTRTSASLGDYWLRLCLLGQRGLQTAFIGQISTETREIEGSDNVRSGEQLWTAHGPEQILRRIHVSRSYWTDFVDPNVEREIGWVPDVNGYDDWGYVGGRSSVVFQEGASPSEEDCYRYGSANPQRWNHYQYLRYLVRKFLDEGGTTGPKWSIGGQTDILKGLETTIPLDDSETVAEILAKLIPRKFGVDYFVRNTPNGFEIVVYALTAADWSYRGQSLPRNPNTVRVYVGRSKANVRTVVEQTDDWHFDKIRILGRRAIVCCSLAGDQADLPEEAEDLVGTLDAKWMTELETSYQAGAGDGAHVTAEMHDRARQDERFTAVYAAFGAPSNWDKAAAGVAVAFTDEGDFDPTTTADYQHTVRRTLDSTPLSVSIDYSAAAAEDFNPANHTAEYLPPCVWLSSPAQNDRFGYVVYERADKVNVGVSAAQNDWGVVLSANPNHLLAAGHWGGAPAPKPTLVNPVYDHEYSVVTFAFETDQRPAAVYEISTGDAKPSGGVIEIVDEEIEAWILAPNTVIGVDQAGKLKTSGTAARVLRDDAERMAMAMAGALARYYQTRARAEIAIDGLMPWTGLLGHVLTAVEDGGDTSTIQAPITSIDWYVGEDQTQTIIRTGYAQ